MAVNVTTDSETAFGEKSTVTVTKPTGTVDDDLLIVAIYHEDRTVNSVPSGWGTVQTGSSGDAAMTVYWKVADTEGASWNWGLDASANAAAWCGRITEYGTVTVIDTSAVGTALNDPTPSFANTITPANANSLLLFIVGVGGITTAGQDNTSAYAIVTSNPTWTEESDIDDSANLDSLGVASAIRPEVTATGNSSCTIGDGSTESGADSVGVIIAIAPRTDVTVSPAVVDMTAAVQAPTVTGGANVSPAVIDLTATVVDPTVTTGLSKWINKAKSAASSFTNKAKS